MVLTQWKHLKSVSSRVQIAMPQLSLQLKFQLLKPLLHREFNKSITFDNNDILFYVCGQLYFVFIYRSNSLVSGIQSIDHKHFFLEHLITPCLQLHGPAHFPVAGVQQPFWDLVPVSRIQGKPQLCRHKTFEICRIQTIEVLRIQSSDIIRQPLSSADFFFSLNWRVFN